MKVETAYLRIIKDCKTINEEGAEELIKAACRDDENVMGCRGPGRQGSQWLGKTYLNNTDKFEDSAKKKIVRFVNTEKIGPVQDIYLESLQFHPRITNHDAKRMIETAKKENKAESSGWLCYTEDGPEGTLELECILREHPEQFDPDAKDMVSQFLTKQKIQNNRTSR